MNRAANVSAVEDLDDFSRRCAKRHVLSGANERVAKSRARQRRSNVVAWRSSPHRQVAAQENVVIMSCNRIPRCERGENFHLARFYVLDQSLREHTTLHLQCLVVNPLENGGSVRQKENSFCSPVTTSSRSARDCRTISAAHYHLLFVLIISVSAC